MDMIIWSPGVTLDAVERQVIEKTYQFFKLNKTATANALGIAIRTLENKLERYRLEDAEAERASDEIQRNRDEFLRRSREGGPPIQPRDDAPRARSGAEADTRHGVESAPILAEKQAVPVSVRSEVQGVLPSEPTRRRKRTAGGQL